ncbi:helix-turn-helix domain-containing protein [Acetobacterium malicum]|uniref:Helix-turn-helix domain-containing protein n=1 Tax=Acetobacterium malicum TaxID=52692 RepID=A0ABR6Z2C8_9FIRM|nr:helix-turn-helix domain-containing protein [Acetobacterium malicum]MBC3901564.1 helix-turn-helix domain-containing protein [Acetobacterium malicum]
MKFGDRLKLLRLENNMTQEELGNLLSKSKNNISQYETGKREPDLETLKIISNYFKVSLDYLLGNSDDPLPVRDVDQDLHDEHDYNEELDAFLKDDEMSSMFYDYKNWSEEEKRNLLNILKGQEALRQMNKKK